MRTSIVKLAFFSFLLIIQTNLFAQLIVTNNGNAQTLVPSTFVGTDVTVSNITYAGQPINLGSFNCSTCNFGLSEGLILSTGNPSTASGVASVFASSGTLSNVGDADLTTLAGATTYDRCVIEFDVVAINNKLEMQFQFASEEYDEYVGSFSDPMAIWISGPGITGSQNIALVPLTVNPININTINNGQTWSGLPTGPCTSCAFYHTNFGGTEIAFDGYTTVLTASKIITPGNTYHIKIAVADASDAIYDSAILLGKNSLRSVTAAVGCAGFAVSAGNDTIMCGGNPHLTATPAIAGNYLYSWSPSAGLNDATLQNPNIISTISNMSYVITVTDSVNGCVASDTVNVSAYLNQIDTVNVCDFSVPLTLDATSPGAFSYDWGGGIFTTTNLVSAAGVYTCTITNSFGCTITHTFNVFNNGFMVDIGPDFTDCNQHSLNAQVIGGGNYVYSWSPVPAFGGSTSPTVVYSQQLTNQVITVTVTDTITGCVQTDQLIANLYASSQDTLIVCNPVNLTIPFGAQGITWSYTAQVSGITVTLPDTTATITTTQPGDYVATATYLTCGFVQKSFHVIDTCFILPPPTNYYWVGASGNFNDTLHWAITSGGAIHPSTAPDYNSNIYFDINSGLTSVDTIIVTNAPVVRDFNVNTNDTLRFKIRSNIFYQVDISSTGSINIQSPIKYYVVNLLYQFGIKMMSGNQGNTVLVRNTSLFYLEFDGAGEWSLSDSLNVDRLTCKRGVLHTNNNLVRINVEMRIDYGLPVNKEIYLGTSEMHIGAGWYANSNNPNLIVDADSATFLYEGTTFNHLFEGTSAQHYNKIISNGSVQFTGQCKIHSIVSNGFGLSGSVTADSIIANLNSGQFVLFAGGFDTLTVKDNIAINVLNGTGIFQSNTTGYFNLLNGFACFDYLNIANVHSIGAPVYAGANSVNGGNNTGIFFAPCGLFQPYYWVGGTGNWSDTLHWAFSSGGNIYHSTPPLDINDVIFDANSFSSATDSVYGSPTRMDCKTFDASQVNTAATFFFNSDLWVNGSFFLSQYVNWKYNHTLVIYPHGDMDFNTNGIDLDATTIYFFGNANEIVHDDITTKGDIVADSAGTLYFNNVTVNAESFAAYFLIQLHLGTSVFNLQSSFLIGNLQGSSFVNGDSSFINVGRLSNGTIGMFNANRGTYNYVNADFIGGSPTANLIYGTYYDVDYINAKEAHVRARNFENNIWFVNTVSTTSYVGKLIFDPVDTVLFETKKLHVDTLFFNNPNGICLTDFQDTVFVAKEFAANSSSGNFITLYDTNTVAGSLVFTTANAVCFDYMKLKGMIGGGQPNFFAGANSIDWGGNSGWIFSSCIDSSNVWPGDANYDLIVNSSDFLNIGLGYGYTGPIRAGATLNYVAQSANDWGGFFSTGVNYKHADCNGDGLVDITDTTAIGLNYGQTHPARYVAPQLNTTIPNLSLQIAQDTIGLNQTFYLNINLGDIAFPVDSIYGLAFTLQTDATLIDTSQTSNINYIPSILGTFGTDLFSYEKNFFSNGYLDAAASRINHINLIGGYGTVGRLGIVTTDNIAAREMIHVNVSSGYGVTANGTIINLNGIGDSILLDPNFVGIHEYSIADEHLLVYPNPSTGLVYLNNGNEMINEIQLTDSKGMLIQTWKPNSTKTAINLSDYQTGFYILRAKCGDVNVHRKLNLLK